MNRNIIIAFLVFAIVFLFISTLNDSKKTTLSLSKESLTLDIINDSSIYKNMEFNTNNVISLDENYYITDLFDGNIIDINNDNIVNFNDLITNKEGLKETIYNNLRINYPKFVVDQVIDQDINVIYMDDKMVTIKYDNTVVSPSIKNDVIVKLICRDYKDYVSFSCNTELTENLNIIPRDATRGVVALTFDDGPCNNTYKVIEELNNNNMKATFFELGSMMKSYPDVVRAVKENGFEIASHGYSHKSFLKLGVNGVQNELDRTNEIYKEITGEDLSLVRPPYGSINVKIRDGIDTTFIKWSVDSLDWKMKDSRFIDNIMSTVKDGDIILMHDIHKTSADGLETLLPLLYSKGFDVVTVSELAKEKGIELEKNKVYFSIR